MTYEAVIAALADPTRRAILEALRDGRRSVTDLAAGLPVSRPAVSQHLAILREAGLVQEEKEGTRRYYDARAEGLEELRRYLEGYWGELLEAFAAEARASAKSKRTRPAKKGKR